MTTPILFTDFYKTGHMLQYPEGTEFVYSNLTPRGSRIPEIDHVVVFGVQYFIKEYLINRFNKDFFSQPKNVVIGKYKRRMDNAMGKDSVPVNHLEELWELGYLPIRIKALPEGTLCPMRVPMLTITNTLPKFSWLTNFLETILSSVLWMPMTSATIAFQYRKILSSYAEQTSDMLDFVQWQGHDFSFRGQSSLESAVVSGGAHLLSFTGTDTIPAIDWLEEYYGANCENELIGGSVPATEHSVQCMGGKESELETYDRLISKVYPKGIVSIVSDTWDYWKILTNVLPVLKNKIMARDGKVVVRPDSGDPVKIICGDRSEHIDSPAYKGTIELLWETFGGTVNSKGYKQLDSHIGCIYGDSITLERCKAINEGLAKKGFASTNMVYGIGSFTYQHTTRDVFGFAIKATYGVINGKPIEIFKDPKTDDGVKKSAKGLLRVDYLMTPEETIVLYESVTPKLEQGGLLETVFEDGRLVKEYTLSDIRARLLKNP